MFLDPEIEAHRLTRGPELLQGGKMVAAAASGGGGGGAGAITEIWLQLRGRGPAG